MNKMALIVLSVGIALLAVILVRAEPDAESQLEIQSQTSQASAEAPSLARFILTNDSNSEMRVVGLSWC